MQKALKIGIVALLGSSLSGCIAAAAAVPLLAGTGVVGSRVVDNRGRDDVDDAAIPRPPFDRPATPAATPPAPAPEAAPPPAGMALESATTPALTASSGLNDPAAIAQTEPARLAAQTELAASTPAEANPPAPVEVAEVVTPQIAVRTNPSPTVATPSGTMPPIELTLPDGRRIAVSDGGAPATELAQIDTPASIATAPGTGSIITGPYGSLYEFAMAKSEPLGRGERRDSALLVAPGALRPDTSRCGATQPAILIDLDPGDELLDPTARFATNPALAQALASLRERNVSVHWMSGNSAAFAGALRSRLVEAELDPDGKDELVLMRYPDDRKQVRRRAVGATHCLVAIAGEERGDFDELYQYLRTPDAALALEALVGQGWFLIPPALVSKDEN